MLTADEATAIARRNGLGIADAVALRALADDTETAERVAQRFARPEEVDEAEFAASLLRGRSQPEPEADVEPDLLAGNHVPREGSNPGDARSDDAATFVRALFDHQQ